MRPCTGFLVSLLALTCVFEARAQQVTRDIPYAKAHERQVLDVYAPAGAKNLPVVFWIHGGGWQTGDKTMVQLKPQGLQRRRLRLRLHQLSPVAERGDGGHHP